MNISWDTKTVKLFIIRPNSVASFAFTATKVHRKKMVILCYFTVQIMHLFLPNFTNFIFYVRYIRKILSQKCPLCKLYVHCTHSWCCKNICSFIIAYFIAHFNPILHTAWLNNHALTLKRNTAKYYLVKNPVFANLPKILLLIKKNLSQTQRLFLFQCYKCFKNVNLKGRW